MSTILEDVIDLFQGPVKGIPKTIDTCCFCVADLRIATILISLATLIFPFSGLLEILVPVCDEFKSGVFGIVVRYVMSSIYVLFALALIAAALIMLWTTLMTPVMVKPYIYMVLIYIIYNIIFKVTILIRILLNNRQCYKRTYLGDHAEVNEMTSFISHIITGVILVYFCLVVNSYAIEEIRGLGADDASEASRPPEAPGPPQALGAPKSRTPPRPHRR